MDAITLQNYRCFGPGAQTARLAPLTLLVGPNGTGKTSFLALVRALWDVAFDNRVPNFREAPYDLGSFQDIIHHRGGRAKNADRFAAGFEYTPMASAIDAVAKFDTTFADRRTTPFPVLRRFADKDASIEIPQIDESEPLEAQWRTNQGKGSLPLSGWRESAGAGMGLFPLFQFQVAIRIDALATKPETTLQPDDSSVSKLFNLINLFAFPYPPNDRPVASAPVQSRPLRTYDPVQLAQDPHGASVPSYLASLYRNDPDEWQRLKTALDTFGQASGLFDEIAVKSFGKSDGDPFQLQVRKSGKRRKGPWRNLLDAGYGVSQALPLIVELAKSPDNPSANLPGYRPPALLLQQPEVHLHPQAEAALGTLFASTAAAGRQIILETHSDYIIDRVRMDVRDETTGLKPEDVSILYFEPGDLEVKIHNIRLDQMGNVLDAPPSYGAFFMAEVDRSIGLVKPNVRDT